MKTLLLASTALVGFAGAAAAEIELTGYAEIGIFGGSGGVAPAETQFHNDWHINFNFSGETDGGLAFGGKVQIEEANGSDEIDGDPKIDDENFWVSGSFGKVTLGNTDGALDWAVPEVYSGSSLNDDHSTHSGAYWNTGLDGTYDNQIARYEYSFGDFGAAFSLEMDDTGVLDPVVGLGGKWSGTVAGTDVTAGLGVQDDGTNTIWSLGATAKFAGGFGAALNYADLDGTPAKSGLIGPAADTWWGLGVSYNTGALTVGANYGNYDLTAGGSQDGWGLFANYDLGGGAVAMFGYGSSDASGSTNGNGDDTWSAGLGLLF
jgi:outer membrane protein OmpU